MKNRNYNNSASKQISAESQCVYDEWADDDHHIISQVTVIIWHVKNHLVILAVTNEAAADSVSELHAAVHRAADDADAQKEKQMKQSCMNWCQKIMKDWSTDINAHEKNSTAAWKIINNMKLLTHDD